MDPWWRVTNIASFWQLPSECLFHFNLFKILKKRLESAYDIQQDFKFLLKEQDAQSPASSSVIPKPKLPFSKISQSLSHYRQNCSVKGVPEIE